VIRISLLAALITLLAGGCYDVTYPGAHSCRHPDKVLCPDNLWCDPADNKCKQRPPDGQIPDSRPWEAGVQPPDGSPADGAPGDSKGPAVDYISKKKGKVAHWKLDENGSGEAKDSSGNEHTAQLKNGVGWQTGCIMRTCLSFDGKDDYLATKLKFVASKGGSFTWSAWIKTSAQVPMGVMGVRGTKVSGEILELMLDAKAGSHFWLRDTGLTGAKVQFKTNVFDGFWHHIAVIRNPARDVRVYVDGKQAGAANDQSTAKAVPQKALALMVGAVNDQDNATAPFSGAIDDVQVHTEALPKSEIEQMYSDGYWAFSGGGSDQDIVEDVFVHGEGDTFITGSVKGQVKVGTKSISPVGFTDLLVARLNTDSTAVWFHTLGGKNAHVRGKTVTADTAGNCYVAGEMRGTAKLDGKVELSSDPLTEYDPFVMKIDPKGKPVWSHIFKDGKSADIAAIASAGLGETVVAGAYTGSVKSLKLPTTSATDAFVARLDASGKPTWGVRFAGAGSDRLNAVVVDAAGDIYAAGPFSDSFIVKSTTLFSNGKTDIALVKLDKQGNAKWAMSAGGVKADQLRDMVEAGGEVVLVGTFNDEAKFGSHNLKAGMGGQQSAFLAWAAPSDTKDIAGSWIKARAPTGKGASLGYGVGVDYAGNVYLAGNFSLTVNFDGHSLTSTGDNDLFVVRYNTQGKAAWARKAGGLKNDFAQAMSTNQAGYPLVVGGNFYSKPGTFGGHPFSSNGNGDLFVWNVAAP